jgi:predicted GNAT family acetyltransferase
MEARFHDDPAAFWAVTRHLYEAEPVRHTTVLSVVDAVLNAPQENAAPLLLVTVHDDAGSLCSAALRTPPWPMALSGVRIDDVPLLVKELLHRHPELDSVMGPRDVAEAFAAAWATARDRTVRTILDLRLYRLGELVVPEVDGQARFATEADLAVVAEHWFEFSLEANAHRRTTRAEALDAVRRQIALGGAFALWEVDGLVVSSAGVKIPNSGASRIGPVYTPPAHRRRGFAAAATAAAARWAHQAGASAVLLYTDLANPTSNGVYQRIGFRPVSDYVELAFDPPR